MDMDALMATQEMFPYFDMLNGPTYVNLVKDFWVSAEVYDLEAAKAEELQAVTRDPSLRGKTRKEMGLEPFIQTEIRSAVMGIPITITEEVIAKACMVASTGRFLWNVNRTHPLLDSFKGVVLKGNSSTKLVDIDGQHRMLLKFMTECFFQKGGGSDQPSVDHKLVLYFLAAFDKINLPKYLMHHLCWAVKEGIRGKRKQIPCGRLLSEIFTQGKLLKTLRRNNLASDKTLRIKTGKMINGKTLQNMKIIKKFFPNEKDLKESTAQTELMKDFPPIYQERNPEVLAKLIADFVKESDIRRRAPEDTSSEARSSEATVIRSISPEATSPELTKYNVRSVQPRTLQPPSLQLCFHIKTRITITLLQTLFLFKWNRFEISSSKDKYQIRQKINGEESKLHARQVDVTTKFSTSLKSSINRDEDLENKY